MSKDKDLEKKFEDGSSESLNIYMKNLSKFPVLTRKQELNLAKKIKTNKNKLMYICLQSEDSVNEILKIRNYRFSRIKKIFRNYIDEDTPDEKVIFLKDTFIKKLEERPNAEIKKLLRSMIIPTDLLNRWLKPIEKSENETLRTQIEVARGKMLEARNRLVECNLRLVFSRAKSYLSKGLVLEDLLQEGNMGLLVAVEKFDHTKGYRFSTYATWWIEQKLGRAVANKSRLIRIPVYMVDSINKISRSEIELYKELERLPEPRELAKRVEISEEKIELIKELSTLNPTSLDDATNFEGQTPPLDSIIDPNTLDPLESLHQEELYTRMRAALTELSPQAEMFLRLKFGIGEKKTS